MSDAPWRPDTARQFPHPIHPQHHGPHGSRAYYVGHRCRCEHCRHANATYEARRPRRADHRVPAARAQAHLRTLMARGTTLRALAHQAGVARATLERVLSGTSVTIRSQTETAILSLSAPRATLVESAHAQALVDLLVDAGYSRHEIASRARVSLRWRGTKIHVRRFDALMEAARAFGAEFDEHGRPTCAPLPASLARRIDEMRSHLHAPAR